MKVSDLRGILQYIPRFRDRIFVISVDGSIVASANFSNILLDIAVLKSLSIKVILVHGAGHQINELAKSRNVSLTNSDGTGITDEATLQLSIDAASRLTNQIMQGLTSVDLRAAQANAIIAHTAGILQGEDQLHTGKVEKVDTRSIDIFLNDGIIPVIPPLGFDGEGGTYRVNSDAIAAEVGQAMKASKVIFLTAEDGLVIDGQPIHQLSIDQTEELLEKPKKISSQNLISKLTQAAKACQNGVPRVHLLDGREDEALLAELFSNEGVGTMIYTNEYQQIRQMERSDVRNAMALIRQSVDSEQLIRRRHAEIVEEVQNYYVLEIDKNLVGCISLIPYEEENVAELACLYVSTKHENEGYGAKLMKYVERLARDRGFSRIFALSTQTYKYFIQKGGYTEASPETLPPARLEKHKSAKRQSKVLVKDLSSEVAGKHN